MNKKSVQNKTIFCFDLFILLMNNFMQWTTEELIKLQQLIKQEEGVELPLDKVKKFGIQTYALIKFFVQELRKKNLPKKN